MNNRTLLVTGSTIGEALANELASYADVSEVIYTYRRREPVFASSKIRTQQLELTSEEAIKSLMASLASLDGVINTVGFLHDEQLQPEKTIARFSPENLARNIELNTLPTALLAKHSRAPLKKSPSSIFATVSAKVGSIEDNRLGGWYSYRASKAALNMLLKTIAIEWQFALANCTVAALHPGTVESPLSEPFAGRNHSTVSPQQSAKNLLRVIDDLTPRQTGRFWSWNGSEIPW